MPSGHRPQPPVGTARVALSGSNEAGTTWVNVYWLNLTATTHVIADLNNIVNAFATNWQNALGSQMSTNYSFTEAKASWLYASGNSLETVQTQSYGGGISGAEATDATAAVINWSISDFYRGGHPRSYLAGIPQSKITNGRTLATAYASTLATNANTLIGEINALTHGGISAVTMGTVRFASGNAWLSPPVFRAYQGASVRSILGTQRRRLGA